MTDKRTLQQNKALHKFFELLANDLNSAGLDMKRTLKESIDIPWTPTTVKDWLWRPIQEAMLNIESTSELDKKQINEIYQVLTKHLSERFSLEATVFPHIPEEE